MPRHRAPAPVLAPLCALQGATYSTRLHCWTARGPQSLLAEMAAVWALPYHASAQSSLPMTK
eukprot:3736964-Lingulodinium_polyedra.AAC.1